ncbi:MAG: hypothetical protein AAF170_13795 [Bacteroidota bacterium]
MVFLYPFPTSSLFFRQNTLSSPLLLISLLPSTSINGKKDIPSYPQSEPLLISPSSKRYPFKDRMIHPNKTDGQAGRGNHDLNHFRGRLREGVLDEARGFRMKLGGC